MCMGFMRHVVQLGLDPRSYSCQCWTAHCRYVLIFQVPGWSLGHVTREQSTTRNQGSRLPPRATSSNLHHRDKGATRTRACVGCAEGATVRRENLDRDLPFPAHGSRLVSSLLLFFSAWSLLTCVIRPPSPSIALTSTSAPPSLISIYPELHSSYFFGFQSHQSRIMTLQLHPASH